MMLTYIQSNPAIREQPPAFNKDPISYHDNTPIYPPPLFSHGQWLGNMNTMQCHINTPAITATH